jgi:hypothetical protein
MGGMARRIAGAGVETEFAEFKSQKATMAARGFLNLELISAYTEQFSQNR